MYDAVEKVNKQKLMDNCVKTTETGLQVYTKSKFIHDVSKDDYIRKPLNEIIWRSKLATKTIILARSGMLECGKNFKGTIPEKCRTCESIDDENHRLNDCITFRDTNFYDSETKVDFHKIYSNDIETLREIIPIIQKVWNTKTAHGTMAK